MKTESATMSSLNPNASVFVPAARRVVAEREREVAPVEPVVPAAVDLEVFSPEWWHLVQTDAVLREQWLSMLSFASEEERVAFAKDLDELADLDQFLDYQEELVDLEEEEIMALEMGMSGDFWDSGAESDSYMDDGQRVTSANTCKDVKSSKQQQQQQQAAWSKSSFKYQNKAMPQKVGNYPKKWNTYRIHQPRADM